LLRLVYVRLGHCNIVSMICSFFDFILQFLCLTCMDSIQDTATIALDRYDILFAGDKTTPASVQGVGVDFEIHMDYASPQRLKRVRNRTARIRCVYGSTDSYRV
jgi:hypothetical protein